MTIVGTAWAPRGPSPITDGSQRNNGMVTATAVHPADANVVYIGTTGGGVWKTLDGGGTWRPLFDHLICGDGGDPAHTISLGTLGIGEPMGIALDPNDADIVYVGSSSRSRVFAPHRQAGLFKSV